MTTVVAMYGDELPLPAGCELPERSREIIDFERSWWLEPGPKGEAIRVQLGMSPSNYRRTLHGLLDNPDALAYDPLTVRRLARRRDERRRERLGGRRADPRLP